MKKAIAYTLFFLAEIALGWYVVGMFERLGASAWALVTVRAGVGVLALLFLARVALDLMHKEQAL